jgi:hypothetical protein
MINEKGEHWEWYGVTDNNKQIVIKWENEFELWDMVEVNIDKWVVFKLEWTKL